MTSALRAMDDDIVRDPSRMDWAELDMLAARIDARFAGRFTVHSFDYVHAKRLQRTGPMRLRKDYVVRASYTRWGRPDRPLILCMGGIANTARRFDYLAEALCADFSIVCSDWVGRGLSGWLATQDDYRLETMVSQMEQLIGQLGVSKVTLVGSSLGGSVAIELAARFPRLVERIVLNDVGPFIPARRRRRRAESVARHYVFRSPADLFRRLGAAQKHDGSVGDEVLLHNSYHQTRWSDEEGGRIYRHDPRAMQAYREDARTSLDQWHRWWQVRCPVLVMHGMESDVLSPAILDRMTKGHEIAIVDVPDTGHTPTLSEPDQIAAIAAWLDGRLPSGTRQVCASSGRVVRRLFV